MNVRALLPLLFAALLSGAAIAREPPVDYQEPPPSPPGTGKLNNPPGGLPGGTPSPQLPGVGAYSHLPAIDESQLAVIAVVNKPYWKEGIEDKVLDNACRLGEFYTLPLNRIVMRFTDPKGPGLLQVVMPDYRNLLVDTRRRARNDETYLFKDTTTTACQVWVLNGTRPVRQLDARGTSLPPVDPNELAKKKAAIKSWPTKSITAGSPR